MINFSSLNWSKNARYFGLSPVSSEGIKTTTGFPLETASDTIEIDSPETTTVSHRPRIPPTTPGRFDSLAITRSAQRLSFLKAVFNVRSAQSGVRRDEAAKSQEPVSSLYRLMPSMI